MIKQIECGLDYGSQVSACYLHWGIKYGVMDGGQRCVVMCNLLKVICNLSVQFWVRNWELWDQIFYWLSGISHDIKLYWAVSLVEIVSLNLGYIRALSEALFSVFQVKELQEIICI